MSSASAPHRYCPLYCEENVWHLAQAPALPAGQRHVALITNATRRTLLFRQRAGAGEEGRVLWDYHVVLLAESARGVDVYDLDTTLPFPSPLRAYAEQTFKDQARLRPELRAHVRLMSAEAYVRGLRSDRGHMCAPQGAWLAPPPDWPLITGEGPGAFTLQEALDLSRPEPGVVLDVRALLSHFP